MREIKRVKISRDYCGNKESVYGRICENEQSYLYGGPEFRCVRIYFGAKYRASETMPEWFAKQTPEVQAAFYNAEKAIDEVLESFSEMMGLKRTSRNIAHGRKSMRIWALR